MGENEKKKNSMIIFLIIIVIVLLIFAVIYFVFMKNNDDASSVSDTNLPEDTLENANIQNLNMDYGANPQRNTNSVESINTNSETATPKTTTDIITKTNFTKESSDWYEHIWYNAADSEGEVTYGSDGVTFTGLKSNSRSGIKTDLEVNVSEYSSVVLNVVVTNKTQTLTGTGWNGREAPVAVAVSYTDIDGTKHASLGEDPTADGQMFWRGFYTLEPDSSSKATNGVKVTANKSQNVSFDLMALEPKPEIIHYVGLEGAGWKDRVGTVHSLSLKGTK